MQMKLERESVSASDLNTLDRQVIRVDVPPTHAGIMAALRRARFKGEWDDITASKILAAPASQDRHIELGDMQRALMHLPQPQREALILVGAGGFAYEEAAEICGCAVGTIKSRVARGRVALEQLLSSGKLPSRRQHRTDPDKSALQTIMGEVDELSRDHEQD